VIRKKKHTILVQWFMDSNGLGQYSEETEERIDELLDLTDKEFSEEWDYYRDMIR